MTSRSNDTPKPPTTPAEQLLLLLTAIVQHSAQMRDFIDKEGTVSPELLSHFIGMTGELIWTAGAVEAAKQLGCLADEESKIEVVH
jgi:hypothetical protein